jgi:hypothetical protein
MTRLNVNEAWYEAVFASALQPSDSATPDVAAGRMRWVRQLAHAAGGGR